MRTVDDLLGDADVAMYQAKAQGKGRHQVFAGAADRSDVPERAWSEPRHHVRRPTVGPAFDGVRRELIAADRASGPARPRRPSARLGPHDDELDPALDAFRAVDEAADRFLAGRHIPGVAYAVVLHGDLIHVRGIGTLRVAGRCPAGRGQRLPDRVHDQELHGGDGPVAARWRAARASMTPSRLMSRTLPGCAVRPPTRRSSRPPSPHDVGGLPDRRSVGRSPAGSGPRPLRRAAARRTAAGLDARRALRVLEPRVRDPRPGRSRTRRMPSTGTSSGRACSSRSG